VSRQLERVRKALANGYAIEHEIGRGSMATVYRARDLVGHRTVAVKVPLPEIAVTLVLERFYREIRILGALSHPYILPLLDTGERDEIAYYVTPYAAGGSLRARLEQGGPLPIADVLTLARQVGEALDFAHARGVIHRDIKPENIVFHEGRAQVCDFGMARAFERAGGETISSSGLVIGTPAYMSPEQALADAVIDGRTDLYALGCVLYECLTGEPPLVGATAQATFARHAADPPPSIQVVRPETPAAVEAGIFAALAKRPADRPASGAALAQCLTA